MASGTSTPTSAGSYTEAEMVAKLGLAADAADTLKVKEINELLHKKGVNGRGKKPQKAKQLALVCTHEEVQTFRAEKEEEALAVARAKAQKRGPGQLSIEECVARLKRARREQEAVDFIRAAAAAADAAQEKK